MEVVNALLVAHIDSVALHEENRVAFIRIEDQLFLRCLDRCKLHVTFTHATMTSVPSLTLVVHRSGSRCTDSAGRIRTRFTPWVSASRQAFSFGNMPPETRSEEHTSELQSRQ